MHSGIAKRTKCIPQCIYFSFFQSHSASDLWYFTIPDKPYHLHSTLVWKGLTHPVAGYMKAFFPQSFMRFLRQFHPCSHSCSCNAFFMPMPNMEGKNSSFWNCKECKKILIWHLGLAAVSSRLFLDNLGTTRHIQ